MTPSLRPFFTYYGGKFRVAPKYPAPEHALIVEPFAGSAGYSLRYPDKHVALLDLDENIVQTWDYLIHASEAEIAALPDIGPEQTIDDLDMPTEARLLIGWWLNPGSSQPKKRPSTFMRHLNHEGQLYWGPRVRARIVPQLQYIRHWRVGLLDYRNLDLNPAATWFIDPPYEAAGKHYRRGAKDIDYAHLGEWCRARRGQVIVCEADEAAWLPFQNIAPMKGTDGRQKMNRARVEVVWTNAEVSA